MQMFLRFAAAGLLSLPAFSALAAGSDSGCPHAEGFISAPMVPTERAARTIYLAVEREIVPANLKLYPIVVVTNDGDHWDVSQTNNEPPRPAPPGVEAVTVSVGGGQLHMLIDKCTGAISHVSLNR